MKGNSVKTSRRSLLKGGLGQLALSSVPLSLRADNKTRTPFEGLPIIQGATSDHQTQFAILHPKDQKIQVHAKSSHLVIKPSEQALLYRDEHPTAVTHVYFENLQLGKNYELVITDLKKEPLDQRQFTTIDTLHKKSQFVIGSCMNDTKLNYEIWQKLYNKKPEFIFFIGDSVYADSEGPDATPEVLWRRFCECREKLPFSYWPKLIPIFATWDDHDFGANDQGEDYPYSEESLKNFHSFFPHNPDYCDTLELGPGASKTLSMKGQKFHLMDCRSFRKPAKSKDLYAHWGEKQENWLFNSLKNQNFNWLLNGSQIFPGSDFKESLSKNHKANFKSLVKKWAALKTKIIFASGDVHFSEISKITNKDLGYETAELTASGIHSFRFPGLPLLYHNPRRLYSTSVYNFSYIETSIEKSKNQITMSCITKEGREKFSHSFFLNKA